VFFILLPWSTQNKDTILAEKCYSLLLHESAGMLYWYHICLNYTDNLFLESVYYIAKQMFYMNLPVMKQVADVMTMFNIKSFENKALWFICNVNYCQLRNV